MISILGTIPRDVVVACSGGVDSMAIVDFLKRSHNVELAFFHHGTETSNKAGGFFNRYCVYEGLPLKRGYVENKDIPKGLSQEEYWRNERYKFLESFDKPVITCHHIDDVLETWIFSCANGNPSLIPYKRNNIIRPFLLNNKQDFIDWNERHSVPFIEDESNLDLRYKRNYIRHKVVPEFLKVNEGIHKVLRRKVRQSYDEYIASQVVVNSEKEN